MVITRPLPTQYVLWVENLKTKSFYSLSAKIGVTHFFKIRYYKTRKKVQVAIKLEGGGGSSHVDYNVASLKEATQLRH